MVITVLMIAAIVLVPWLMQTLAARYHVLQTLGSVFLCYAAGILLSFPLTALGANTTLASDIASVLVCMAMPLILFSADLSGVKRLAKPMLTSFLLNGVAVLVIAVGSFFIFRNVMPDAEKISGMLIGTYTGGTPNMFAIGHGLGASSELMLLLQTSDLIGGGIYFFLILSFLPGLLSKFLPAYRPVGLTAAAAESRKPRLSDHVKSILLAIVCVAVAMGFCLLLPSKFGNTGLAKLSEHTAVMMLIVTTLGIVLSFIKPVRAIPGSHNAGQYGILMFSTAMGLCFDLRLISAKALMIFAMLLVIQFGTVLLHFLLAKLCRIDAHTALITSTAGVFGPAFIIPVANKLKNEEIILSGILCGILGYAIGNYLGIGVGELLSIFM